MGQFSWLDCITGEQILDDVERDSYVLIPKEFVKKYGGNKIQETCYDGYGRFGGYDIFDLVVDWNAKYLDDVWAQRDTWVCDLIERMKGEFDIIMNGGEPTVEKRLVGICLACYDKDNERLKYPIKITHDIHAVYEDCPPSLSDPNQGWYYEEDEDEYW